MYEDEEDICYRSLSRSVFDFVKYFEKKEKDS